MGPFLLVASGLACAAILAGAWLGWQLLRQNGRMLLRVEELEKRLDELEFGEPEEAEEPAIPNQATETGQSLVPPTVAQELELASRFGNRSLARSKLKRDGLKAGTPAPEFRLPRLDGSGDLSLSDLREHRVLLVFSSPSCGPCLELAPQLEKFHRAHPELEVVMISKGEPKENRAKVKEHRLTFPIVLQQQWEISRRYAIFATPVAYLIDERGVIAHDVAVGGQSILSLLSVAGHRTEAPEPSIS